MVNNPFNSVAVVASLPEYWARGLPEALVVPDASVLALEPEAHDLVIHAMALHWADDPVGQLIQCRRALKRDGLMLAVAPGGRTLHELRAVLAEIETAQRGGLSPRVLPMADIRDLGGLMQRAGFAMPVTDAVTLKATYVSLWDLMRELRAMGEGNAMAGRDNRPLTRGFFAAAQDLYAQRFPAPEGRIEATFELMCLTGWAPAETQPKPLRPGSAQQRLADALDTREHPAGDPTARSRD